ncbi:Rieske 2Fe-2S domain-containing protein [Nocardiopsis changdeensis]|uniref:Rieske 2Fe-2S domain-containing protein n=1 Tax=Nocardiopsis changdeensis TaxID=2831969 RepID=A0ABX8BNX0_9ACTN|nr:MULTISPECIES: Rieske 2Fe-2S domain-containing protein [Nocardiopsis]QUX22438.1 Rieske 2Fe-2S domain-containing protein [Nocardiopsis changdeensis]QYX38380.1 Rieske 2Fe-2S domain-containing protein [Nocardiopsis sp. MT53]
MRLGERIRRIEREDRLDPAVSRLAGIAERLPAGKARDLLHGVPLGHPVHPIAVHLPIGTWTAAVLLDVLPGGNRRASRLLIGTGILAALPAAVAGLADWSRLHERQRRVGAVHAAANGAATLLFGVSLLSRLRGREGWGVALGLAGAGAVGLGGLLGGHLSYYRASGANSADALIDLVPEGWSDLGPLDGFPEGSPGRADADGVPVVVVREGESVSALLGACPHMGAPLAEGDLVDGCIRCPWHGSEFRVEDGSVVHGPATAAPEVLETSVVEGRLMVRSPAARY